MGCDAGGDGDAGVTQAFAARKYLFITKIRDWRSAGIAEADGIVAFRGGSLICGYAVDAHVGAENFRNEDGAVGLLVIFDDGDPGAADGEAGTV